MAFAFLATNQSEVRMRGLPVESLEPRRLLSSAFFSQSTVAVGGIALAIVTGDFNGDGRTDIVVQLQSGAFEFIANKGKGKFAAPVSIPTAAATQAGRLYGVADFNNDGVPDLIVNATGTTLGVMLGNGNGGFAPVVDSGLPAGSVAVADLNNDGFPDLISTTVTAAIHLAAGRGDGTFVVNPDITVPKTVRSLSVYQSPGGAFAQIAAGTQGDMYLYNVTKSKTKPVDNGRSFLIQPHDGGTVITLSDVIIAIKAAKVFAQVRDQIKAEEKAAAKANSPEAIFQGDLSMDQAAQNNSGEPVPEMFSVVADTSGTNIVLQPTEYSLTRTSTTKTASTAIKGALDLSVGAASKTFAIPKTVETGDFNADGTDDLLVSATRVTASGGSPARVELLELNGTSKATALSIPLTGAPGTLSASDDLNGDGVPDVLLNDTKSPLLHILYSPTPKPFATLKNGVLSAAGGAGADHVDLSVDAGGKLWLSHNGALQSFPSSSVKKISINLGNGANTLGVGPGVGAVSATGGKGVDSFVLLNASKDTINGGSGKDVAETTNAKDSLKSIETVISG